LQPLGIVVFSGLALATVLTLFIIPCFYLLLHELFGRWSHSDLEPVSPKSFSEEKEVVKSGSPRE